MCLIVCKYNAQSGHCNFVDTLIDLVNYLVNVLEMFELCFVWCDSLLYFHSLWVSSKMNRSSHIVTLESWRFIIYPCTGHMNNPIIEVNIIRLRVTTESYMLIWFALWTIFFIENAILPTLECNCMGQVNNFVIKPEKNKILTVTWCAYS